MTTSAIRVGVDFGGVIVRRARAPFPSAEDTALVPGDAVERAQPGALESFRELVSITDGNAFIVSRAGPKVQARTREWLEVVNFYEITGLERRQVYFSLDRAGKEPICKELGINVFIDDHIDVLEHLRGTVATLVLFSATTAPRWARHAAGWPAVLEIVQLEARRAKSSVAGSGD